MPPPNTAKAIRVPFGRGLRMRVDKWPARGGGSAPGTGDVCDSFLIQATAEEMFSNEFKIHFMNYEDSLHSGQLHFEMEDLNPHLVLQKQMKLIPGHYDAKEATNVRNALLGYTYGRIHGSSVNLYARISSGGNTSQYAKDEPYELIPPFEGRAQTSVPLGRVAGIIIKFQLASSASNPSALADQQLTAPRVQNLKNTFSVNQWFDSVTIEFQQEQRAQIMALGFRFIHPIPQKCTAKNVRPRLYNVVDFQQTGSSSQDPITYEHWLITLSKCQESLGDFEQDMLQGTSESSDPVPSAYGTSEDLEDDGFDPSAY